MQRRSALRSLFLATLLLAVLACPPVASAQDEPEHSDSLEATGCVLKSAAISALAPGIVFLVIAAIIESDGDISLGFNFGGSGSAPAPERRDACDKYIRSWHVAGSGANTYDGDTPMEGRGAFHVGFSFRDFEYSTFAGAGALDTIRSAAESRIFASFGGQLRYLPLGIDEGQGAHLRPYATGLGMVGWNPEGPDAAALEYGGGLELAYHGNTGIETALYGEWLSSHINAGGRGIVAREDDWTWSHSVVVGLRFRWFK